MKILTRVSLLIAVFACAALLSACDSSAKPGPAPADLKTEAPAPPPGAAAPPGYTGMPTKPK